jgi:hypothetical protein
MKPVLTKWPEDLLDAVDSSADVLGITRSEYIRSAAQRAVLEPFGMIVPASQDSVHLVREPQKTSCIDPVASFEGAKPILGQVKSLERSQVTMLPKNSTKK